MALKKEFDDNVVKSNLQKVIELQDKIIHEENLGLEALQEFYWPVEKFPRTDLTIGGQAVDYLERKLRKNHIKVSGEALKLLHCSQFAVLPEKKHIQTILVKIPDLGFTDTSFSTSSSNDDPVFIQARKHGLVLCPSEVAIYQALHDVGQKQWHRRFFAMESFVVDGKTEWKKTFCLENDEYDDGILRLCIRIAKTPWFVGDRLVFCLSQIEKPTRK